LRDDPHARIGVTQCEGKRALGRIAAVFGRQDAMNQSRISRGRTRDLRADDGRDAKQCDD